jgi:hypothetical protein
VIEEGDHLNGIMDGAIVEAMVTKRIEVIGDHVVLVVGQLRSKLAQRPVAVRKRRRLPVTRDRVNERIGFRTVHELSDLFPEVMRVRLRSVVALQFS